MREYSSFLSINQQSQTQRAVSPELVSNLQQAYQRGRKQPNYDSVQAALQSLLLEQSRYLQSRLARHELAMFIKCKSQCAKAEESALHGDVQSACRYLAGAQIISERSDLTDAARVRCQTELAAAESHVDDCCNDFERAKAKVLESMALDEELETSFGYRLTHVHRIHLLNRLVTLEARAGRLPEAISLAASVFRYLERTREAIPLPGSWGHLHLAQLSPGVLQFLTRQLTGEVAGILLWEKNDVALEALKVILQDRPVSTTLDAWDSITITWFDLKIRALQKHKNLPNIHACAEFLEKGPGAATLLWHLTALDIAMICKSLQPGQGGGFMRTVLGHLFTMNNFPWRLKIKWMKFLKSEEAKVPVTLPQ